MFKKLLKHDLRSVGRGWWIVGVTLLAAFIFFSFSFRLGFDSFMKMFLFAAEDISSTDGILEVYSAFFGSLVIMLSYIGLLFLIAAASIATEIMIYWRFYKHLYTDEGYLTFTLPASRKHILRSKTINAMVWEILLLAVIFIGFLFLLLIAPSMKDGGFGINPIVYTWFFGTALPEIWGTIGGWLIVYILLLIPMTVISALSSVSIIQFCITLGSVVVKKYKLLAAIGFYYVVNSIFGAVASAVSWFAMFFFSTAIATFIETASTNITCASIALILLICCVINASFAAVFYFATRNLLERKLNLA